MDGPDGLRGYLTFSREPAESYQNTLTVHDLVADDLGTLGSLLGFLHDLSTMTSTVVLPTHPTEPLWTLVGTRPPDFRFKEPWMVRIVDVAGALAGRGYATDRSLSVRFAVDDPLFGDNHGPWALTVDGGRAVVRRAEDAEVTLDPLGLASLYTGFRTAAQVRQLGHASGDAEALCRLASAFAGGAPWMRDFF